MQLSKIQISALLTEMASHESGFNEILRMSFEEVMKAERPEDFHPGQAAIPNQPSSNCSNFTPFLCNIPARKRRGFTVHSGIIRAFQLKNTEIYTYITKKGWAKVQSPLDSWIFRDYIKIKSDERFGNLESW